MSAAGGGYAKSEKIKICDSNIALLGSAVEKQVKEAAAGNEQAWASAGKEVGVEIWRIENFKVKPVKENIGTFFTGDSYIVLNTFKNNGSDALRFDVHFWLGSETTQDEAGTAAYKTVELDTFLGGAPVQHREIEGFESALFLSYFKGQINILSGGAASGFNIVKPEEYRPRLLWIKGDKKSVRVVEVPKLMSSLNHGDVFILDLGLKIFQWIGSESGIFEKTRSRQICDSLRSERGGRPTVEAVNEGDKEGMANFDSLLDGTIADIKSAAEGASDLASVAAAHAQVKRLLKFSDASGSPELTLLAEGSVSRALLTDEDVFIFDVGAELFVYVGHKCSEVEKAKALSFAQEYCSKNSRPNWLPITRLMPESQSILFESSFT